ncbi:MAG TPA: alpha/beta fold hydrolase [Mycobacterium sp.]|nr:alpha/beta fold hydrolase [Mycobacterium sp.]
MAVEGTAAVDRADVTFRSGGVRCAGWLYRPTHTDGDVACVVMGHGAALTRRDGLALYAEALARAGTAVLVYDHRFLGDSEGAPRQRIRMSEQLADRLAAIAFARAQDGVDPDRIIVWGFSLSGGSATEAAAVDQRVSGAILLCPLLDGLGRANYALRTQPGNAAWIMPRAVRDVVIPATAESGGHAALSFPGELDGFRSITAPGWHNEVRARALLTLPFYRPIKLARKIRCPILIQEGRRDISVPSRAIGRLAKRAPRAVLKRYDCDHFEPFHGEHPTQIIADQVAWLSSLSR